MTTAVLTWAEMLRLEPRLQFLADATRRRGEMARRKRVWCREACWTGSGPQTGHANLKEALACIIGPRRYGGPAELQTVEAMVTASERLRSLIPPCRSCSCR